MIIDFHVHGKITNKYPFDKEKFLLTINEAKENGMDSIALTEHCHANNFLEGYEFLNNNYKFIDDYYDLDGFKVFYGMEVTTEEKLDILLIGNPKIIIQLREQITSNLKDEEFIKIDDLFSFSILDKLLVILAHPFRKHSEFPKLTEDIIEKIDAIEYNAKDLYKNTIENMKNKVQILSNKLNLPIVSGSDTHHFIQMSSVKNIFFKDCKTISELKQEIKLENYKVELSSDLKIRVKSAIIIKKLICNK